MMIKSYQGKNHLLINSKINKGVLKNMSVHSDEKTINILYIEDDPSLCSLINDLLERYSKYFDFNIILKNSLKDGMQYLNQVCETAKENQVDIVLLDLILPNSHGVGTFKKVKRQCPDVPIVIVSGHEDIACECVKLGAQDYLIKTDLSGPTLIRSIKYAIERSKTENLYKDIIRSSTLGYHIFRLQDDDIIFIDYNPAADRILNLDHSKFLFKKLEDVFPNMESKLKKCYYKALTTGKSIEKYIAEYEDDNIKRSFYRINGHRTTSGDLAITFEDISESVYMQENLEISEQKYKQLVEATGAGVYEIDFVNMKFTYANDAICRQSGYSKEELLEMSPFDFLTEKSANKFIDRIQGLKKGEHIDDAVEYEAIRKDGSSIWIMITARFKEDENKNVIGANVVAIDITDNVMTEKRLKKKEAEVFTQLENKIKLWKEEMLIKDEEKNRTLNLINKKITHMSVKNGTEVL